MITTHRRNALSGRRWAVPLFTLALVATPVGASAELLVGENVVISGDFPAPLTSAPPLVIANPARGGFLVAWAVPSASQRAPFTIFAQGVAGDGRLVGDPVAIATAGDGRFAAAFRSLRDEFLVVVVGADGALFARRLSADGVPIGGGIGPLAPFPANSLSDLSLKLAYDSALDQYLIVSNFAADPARFNVVSGHLLSGDGERIRDFTISDGGGVSPIGDYATCPAVVYEASSRRYFVACVGGARQEVFGRFIEANGTLSEPFFAIGGRAAQLQPVASAALDPGAGRFLVAFARRRDFFTDIVTQPIDVTGSARGPSTVVSPATGVLRGPAVVTHEAGSDRQLVVWRDGNSFVEPSVIVARLVDSNGTAIGEPCQVAGRGGIAVTPDAAFDPASGAFLVAWSEQNRSTGAFSILAQILRVIPGSSRPIGLDFDRGGQANIAVYRRTTGEWFIRRSCHRERLLVPWGAPELGDSPVPADFDGDGIADVSVYRRSTGEWFIRRSTDGGLTRIPWGAPGLGDEPVPADFDGDGRADLAVYRTSTGQWFIRRSTDGGLTQIPWGAPGLGDVPAAADFDGDGRTDLAVYRTSTGHWFVRRSTDEGLTQIDWGAPSLNDLPVAADFDGDGRADVAVYRDATGEWFVRRSSDGATMVVPWGAPPLADIPVPGDFDGDGRADVAVFRTSTGQWFIRRSIDGGVTVVDWGSPVLADTPARRSPAAAAP